MAKGVSRDRRRETQWRRAIGEHKRSGLSIREFCRKSKLPESAFYFWRRELERRDLDRREAEQEQRERPSAQAAFVPVTVAQDIAAQAHGRIEIELRGGHRVHVTAPVDRQALAEVLAVLEGQPC
jgi:transposase-like protein